YLLKRINVGPPRNQRFVPIEVRSALIIDGLSEYLAIEVRPAFHSNGGVRSIYHSEGVSAASYGHSAAAAIVDDEIAWKKRCIGKVAACHVEHRRDVGLARKMDSHTAGDHKSGTAI